MRLLIKKYWYLNTLPGSRRNAECIRTSTTSQCSKCGFQIRLRRECWVLNLRRDLRRWRVLNYIHRPRLRRDLRRWRVFNYIRRLWRNIRGWRVFNYIRKSRLRREQVFIWWVFIYMRRPSLQRSRRTQQWMGDTLTRIWWCEFRGVFYYYQHFSHPPTWIFRLILTKIHHPNSTPPGYKWSQQHKPRLTATHLRRPNSTPPKYKCSQQHKPTQHLYKSQIAKWE